MNETLLPIITTDMYKFCTETIRECNDAMRKESYLIGLIYFHIFFILRPQGAPLMAILGGSGARVLDPREFKWRGNA